jgi:hypothetical protein
LKGSGEDGAPVFFCPRRHDFTLAGAPSVEIELNVGLGQGDARGTSVNDDADPTAVGFAVG